MHASLARDHSNPQLRDELEKLNQTQVKTKRVLMVVGMVLALNAFLFLWLAVNAGLFNK